MSKLASELLENNDFKQTVYASKEYAKGILEGGNTSGNTSLAMNFGLGLKTQLSHGIELYFEPEISTSLLNGDIRLIMTELLHSISKLVSINHSIYNYFCI